MILGIDPGPENTAFALWCDNHIGNCDIMPNNDFIQWIRVQSGMGSIPVVEMVQSFGMPVGKSIFETVLLVGRIQEIYDSLGKTANLAYRRDIKLHFCQSVRAKDSNIRQALVDRFGEPGTKKKPGILYGVRKDIWSALAVAVYWHDTHPIMRIPLT